MAKQISSGADASLVQGAAALGKANMPIDMSAANKSIQQTFQNISEIYAAKAKERKKQIAAVEKRVLDYKEKFPVAQNEYNIPKQYVEGHREWVASQKEKYNAAAETAGKFPKGSDEEREQRAIMQNVLYALENSADQWKQFGESTEDDYESFENKEFSAANNADDIIYTADLWTKQAKYLGAGDDGRLLFEKNGEASLYDDRPSPRLKSFKAANALGKEVDRIITRGIPLQGTDLKRSMDVLFSIVQGNDDAMLSLASDTSLFQAYSDDGQEIEPIPGAYEIYQEEGGPEKLRKMVVDKYKSLMIDVSNQAAQDKKERENPDGTTTEFIFDPKTDARISYAESQLTSGDVQIIKGTALNLTGETREWDLAFKDGQLIVSDTKGGVLRDVTSFEQLRQQSEKMQKLK
jgi:hypothetical protein